jgi:Protein of unknown function (DUF2802)
MPAWLSQLSIEPLPFTVSLELLLIAGRAAALIGALCVFAWAFTRWRSAQARDAQRIFEQMDLVHGELHGLAAAVAAISGRLDGLNEALAAQGQMAHMPGAAAQRSYEHAIRLAQRGAVSEEITSQCGLARHEADLLVVLHGRGAPQQRGPEPAGVATTEAEAPVPRKRLSVVS